jgi:hypothetical protein
MKKGAQIVCKSSPSGTGSKSNSLCVSTRYREGSLCDRGTAQTGRKLTGLRSWADVRYYGLREKNPETTKGLSGEQSTQA